MKTMQKLELYSSIAFLLIVFIGGLLSFINLENNEEIVWSLAFIISLFILLLPSMMVLGAYLHTVKKNNTGYIILMFFGIISLCVYGYYAILSLSVGGQNKYYFNLIIFFVMPIFFVGCTMIFASINDVRSSKIKC